MVNEINSLDDFKAAIGDQNTGLIVIDFFTTWCQPCKLIAPKYEKLSEKYPMVKFYKLNAEKEANIPIADACIIQSLPTFCFFKGGQCVDKISGASETLIEQMLIKNLQPQANASTQSNVSPPNQ